MSQPNKSSRILEELDALKKSKERVLAEIRRVEEQLKQVESLTGEVKWLTFRRVTSVKDLAGSHRTLKAALQEDLKKLKGHLRAITAEQRSKALALSKSKATERREALKRKTAELLKKAEKTGVLSEEAVKGILSEANTVLDLFIDILEAEPNEENLSAVLSSMDIIYIHGYETNNASIDKAWTSARKAGKKIWEERHFRFTRNPDVDNLKKLVKSLALNLQFGANIDEFKPNDWRPVGTSHKVKRGDTLSSLSTEYYGNRSYWYIIYIENADTIGPNPNVLKDSTQLAIP